MNLSEWHGVAKASELIGVSQSLLWELKNSNEFIASEHWLYITGKPATPEFIEGATRTFGMWWLRSLEGVRKGK